MPLRTIYIPKLWIWPLVAILDLAGDHTINLPNSPPHTHLYVTCEIGEIEGAPYYCTLIFKYTEAPCTSPVPVSFLTFMHDIQQHGGLLKSCCIAETPPYPCASYLKSLPSAGALGVWVCAGSSLNVHAMGAVQTLLQTSVLCMQRNKLPINLNFGRCTLRAVLLVR